MKTITQMSLVAAMLLGLSASAQTTAFTYQGRLTDAGQPANGEYSMVFVLFDGPTTNDTVVTGVPQPSVWVTNGLFTVTLDLGSMSLDGRNLWLATAIRPASSSGDYTPLEPFQPLTAVPYAMEATKAQSAPAASLTGILPASALAGSYTNAVDLTNAANVLAGDGSRLTGVKATALEDALAETVWTTGGNPGRAYDFIGTTNDFPLEFRAYNVPALYIRADGAGSADLCANPASGNIVSGISTASSVLGGRGNKIYESHWCVLGGGLTNTIFSDYAGIAGGWENTIAGNAHGSFIGGGEVQMIGQGSRLGFIGGGSANRIEGTNSCATISGGYSNTLASPFATAGGGVRNTILTQSRAAVIGGGEGNTVWNFSQACVIGGGLNNEAGYWAATVAGGDSNTNTCQFGFIGGGFNNNNRGLRAATLAGGMHNRIYGEASALSGGTSNIVEGDFSAIAGGLGNFAGGLTNFLQEIGWVNYQGHAAAIGGGTRNGAYGNGAAIGGGSNNVAYGDCSFIGGGSGNIAGNNTLMSSLRDCATVGGGYLNHATGAKSTVAGGWDNTATGQESAILGGGGHRAPGSWSTVLGGQFCSAGTSGLNQHCMAGGRRAKALHDGSFVWADSLDFDFASTTTDQFSIRATGGVHLATGVDGAGVPTAGLSLARNGSAWGTVCDRHAKKNFQELDGRAVLENLAAVPILKWNYHWEADDQTPHIGPMAQEFKAAFFPGEDDTVITTLEFDGVALAAIQGLNQKLEAKSRELEARSRKLEEENTALKARLERLEQLIAERL